MNPFRRQLPVRSRLDWDAVTAHFAGEDPREELAAQLCALYGAERALLTDSGTSALVVAFQLAVARASVRASVRASASASTRSDARNEPLHCALPAFGCYDLATAALGAGVRVRLYDVRAETLAPDLASLEKAAGPRCAAIVLVHHYGVPAPTAQVRTLADACGALLIDDAAQAAGSFAQGARLGSGSDLSVLSFGRGKGVTGGGGGALLVGTTGARALEGIALPHLDAGRRFAPDASIKLVAQWLLARPAIYGIPARLPMLHLGETVFRAPTTPRSMTAAAARVLERTLPLMDSEAVLRRRHADRLRRRQREMAPETMIQLAPGSTPGWLRLPMLAREGSSPDAARGAALGAVRAYPRTLATLPALRPHLLDEAPWPGADALAARLWTLPTHGALEERDLAALESWISR